MKKVALITGAASGIGKEFSKIHAAKGGNIVAVDINAKWIAKPKKRIGKKAQNSSLHYCKKPYTNYLHQKKFMMKY